MISYLLNLLKIIKNGSSYNIIDNFKNSKINIKKIERIKIKLSEKQSDLKDGMFIQKFHENLSVVWFLESGTKKIKKIISNKYQLIIGLKNFIIKSFSTKIKDIRFDKKTGFISKINFKKHYFINFVNFVTGSVSLSIDGFNIKETFNKNNVSDLTKDEWQLLEINSNI